MEFMKIEGLLGGAISSLVNKGIENKFGYRPSICLNNLNLKTGALRSEDDTVILDMQVSMSREDFEKLITEITK